MNKTDYIRHALSLKGFTNPTDEIVEQIYTTAEEAGYVEDRHPYLVVDALVAAMRAYYPTRTSLEFIDSMQKLESQTGLAASEFDELKERLDQLFDTGLPPGVPGTPILPGQVYPQPAPGQPAGAQPGQAPPQGGKL